VFDSTFCCVAKQDESDKRLIDDGTCVKGPIRIGSSILLCGKRKGYFPKQLFVGPDWPLVILVYCLIIGINVVVLGVISPLGWPPVLIGIFICCCLLVAYSCVACSNPGIIFKNDYTIPDADIEDGKSPDEVAWRPRTIECGQCELKRPMSGHHCHYCEVCVDELDHHCPWCGKCIGKNNIKSFWLFVYSMNVQLYYLLGVFIYYIIAVPGGQGWLPKGPGFS
jgi:hypothetical protein